jgi:hypothetical protein
LKEADLNHGSENLKKKIKICEGASIGREIILNFYIRNYKQNMLKELKKNQNNN